MLVEPPDPVLPVDPPEEGPVEGGVAGPPGLEVGGTEGAPPAGGAEVGGTDGPPPTGGDGWWGCHPEGTPGSLGPSQGTAVARRAA